MRILDVSVCVLWCLLVVSPLVWAESVVTCDLSVLGVKCGAFDENGVGSERLRRLAGFRFVFAPIHPSRDQTKEEQEKEDHLFKLKQTKEMARAKLINKFIGSSSSILRDFLTMRY